MRQGADDMPSFEVDAFGLACGTALVAGMLSLVAPFLIPLVGTLAALGLASWAMVRSRSDSRRRAFLAGGRAARLAILGAAGGLYLVPPEEYAPYRALVLACALTPLWWGERPTRSVRNWGGAT